MNIEARVAKLESQRPTRQHWTTCIARSGDDSAAVMLAAVEAYRTKNRLTAAVPVNCIVRSIVKPKELRA